MRLLKKAEKMMGSKKTRGKPMQIASVATFSTSNTCQNLPRFRNVAAENEVAG